MCSRDNKPPLSGTTILFFSARSSVALGLFLVLSVMAVYWQTHAFEFIDYDDDLYVVENERVKSGLTLDNIQWAFFAKTAANWHPITLMSHMADVSLYGMWAGGHHITNVVFHVVNTLLLFYVMFIMTRKRWMSAVVAVLFGVHPLHLDSVEQIAERKDVLSTFFGMLALWGYARYVQSRRLINYMASLTFFLLGLMSKPMLVTLPFVLLLLDYWPLSRFGGAGFRPRETVYRLVLEKAPFLALTLLSSIVTFIVQHHQGAVRSMVSYSLDARLANAMTSYMQYIVKTFFPVDLSFYYPHEGMPPAWEIVLAATALASVSIMAVRTAKTHPFFIVGWLWYLGTLVPVIGLVQVGSQSMADRYTYVPLIGIFIMMSWGALEVRKKGVTGKKALALLAGIAITLLMMIAWRQAGYWKNSNALFERAIAVTENNTAAHLNLGYVLAEKGKQKEAISHYREVIKIAPDHLKAHNNLGLALAKVGRTEEAIFHFLYVLNRSPGKVDVINNMARAQVQNGTVHEAIKYFDRSLRLRPDQADIHNDIGVLLARVGREADAVVHFEKALQIQPDHVNARHNIQSLQTPGYRRQN